MAESLDPSPLPPSSSDVALEKIREEITCAVCQDLFIVPKTLPCLHTFCEQCLIDSENMRRRIRKEEIKPKEVECPQCRTVSKLPSGIEAVATNFTYANMVEHLRIRDRVRTDSGLRCGNCKEDVGEAPAVGFCYDCRAALCQFCYDMHGRAKDLSHHTYRTLEEIKQASSVDVPQTKRSHVCKKHNEELRWYCITCSEMICRDCTVTVKDHRDHSFDFIGDVIEREKEDIVHHVQPLQAMQEEVAAASTKIEGEIRNLKDIKEKRAKSIDQAVDRSVAMLEKRREMLKSEAEKIFEYKSKNLILQLEDLESARGSIMSARDFVTTTLEKGSDVEVLMYKKEMLARSENLTARHSSLPFEILEEDTVQFVYDSEPLRHMGKLCEAPSARFCVADRTGLDNLMQGEEATFTVTAHGSKGQPLIHGGGICSVEVACTPILAKQPVRISGEATDNMDGTYTIGFMPKHPGTNFIDVGFGSHKIQGSPFQVNVVRNFNEVSLEPYVFTVPNASPWGLTMISDKEIAISASDCLVHIYNIDGTETDIIKSNFTRPYGITIDSHGYLWITDREAHNVQKFQRVGGKWERVFQFGQRGVNAHQFSHPRGIAVHPETGYIYISDMKNNRIQVFKPDSPVPKYHAQFGAPGKGPGCFNLPAGLCFDRNNHVVVCDDHNCRLQVFDAEGKFLHSLGVTSAQKGLLCSPIGVTSDQHGRYLVTEFGSHCVSFLSPEGEILSCVRTLGKGIGQFVHPRGLAVDSVGYVYVADNENMRVVRF